MVIATLDSLQPVSISHGAEHPFLIHGIRNAGGPSAVEPVRIMLTETDALALISTLATLLQKFE